MSLQKAFCTAEVAQILTEDCAKLINRAMREEKKAGKVSKDTKARLEDQIGFVRKTTREIREHYVRWVNSQIYEETPAETAKRKAKEAAWIERIS